MSNLDDGNGQHDTVDRGEEIQTGEILVKVAQENSKRSDEHWNSRMPLRKKVNRKTVSKSKSNENESKKKPHDRLKSRPREIESDGSSSEDKYLEDYSTGESDNNYSESDDFSQEFSDEEKLMNFYENKLREHCIVGNIGSCSSFSSQDDDPPEDYKEDYNEAPANNVFKSNSQTISESGSVREDIRRTKPACTFIDHSQKLISARTSSNVSQRGVSTFNNSTAEKFEERFNCQQDEEELGCNLNTTEDIGPSSSNVPTRKVDHNQGRDFGTTTALEEANRRYDPNKKVIDYLNQIGDSGLVDMKMNIRKRMQTKGTSYAAKVEEIHSSSKSHILKNYLSSFPSKTQLKKGRKNIEKRNSSKNTSESESEQSEEDKSKEEVVDRILTSSLSGNAEGNLANLIELWKNSHQTSA